MTIQKGRERPLLGPPQKPRFCGERTSNGAEWIPDADGWNGVEFVRTTGYWVIRTYEAGAVGEKTKFWVPGEKPSRSGRREKTEIRKQLQNEYSVQKQLARLINANFGPGDLLLGLDYSQGGMDRLRAWAVSRGLDPDSPDETERMEAIRQAADWALGNLLRRVKRAMDKEDLVLRYVAITSDMDGDTQEAVRVHHHLVVHKESKTAFISKWAEWGGVDWSSLSRQRDYTPIAEYFIRQVRKVPDAKKYIPSRNLVRPQPRDRTALTDAELRAPKGTKLLFRNEFKPGRPQYIRYMLPREKRHKRPPASSKQSSLRSLRPSGQRSRRSLASPLPTGPASLGSGRGPGKELSDTTTRTPGGERTRPREKKE